MRLVDHPQKDAFAYNNLEHVYSLRDQRLPSFHDVAKRNGYLEDKPFLDPEYLMRGKAVHEGIRLLVLGRLDWDTVSDEIRPRIEAAQKFLAASSLEPVAVEEICVHSAFRYACRLDFLGRDADGLVIVEWKTGVVPPWAGLQTAAQVRALETGERVRRMAVGLLESGRPQVRGFSDSVDFYLWDSAIALWNWQANNGYKMFTDKRR